MDFSKLAEQLKDMYYSDVIILITQICTILIGLRFASKDKHGRAFIFYTIFDSLIFITDWYLINSSVVSPKAINNFIRFTNTLVAFVELSAYYYFFYSLFKSKSIRITLLSLYSFFLLVETTFILTKFSFFFDSYRFAAYAVGALEFALLLPPCVYYYSQLFRKITSDPLTKRPSFWIVTGIFFFAIISIPYYLVSSYVDKNTTNYRYLLIAILFNLPIIINFILLSKAFLCKKPLTT